MHMANDCNCNNTKNNPRRNKHNMHVTKSMIVRSLCPIKAGQELFLDYNREPSNDKPIPGN